MTISSSTDIANLALDLLSVENVQDIDAPSSSTESLMSRWYDLCRTRLLREHSWNFAIKRIILAPDSTDPVFGYTKQFTLPSDFVRLLSISTNLTDDYETLMDNKYYTVEDNKVLLTSHYDDATSLRLIYVYDAREVSKFDPMFVDLLAYELALAVAYKVSESNTNIQRIQSIQRQRSMIARAVDGQENPPKRIERSPALSARRRVSTHRTDRYPF